MMDPSPHGNLNAHMGPSTHGTFHACQLEGYPEQDQSQSQLEVRYSCMFR